MIGNSKRRFRSSQNIQFRFLLIRNWTYTSSEMAPRRTVSLLRVSAQANYSLIPVTQNFHELTLAQVLLPPSIQLRALCSGTVTADCGRGISKPARPVLQISCTAKVVRSAQMEAWWSELSTIPSWHRIRSSPAWGYGKLLQSAKSVA